jgi:hypothetical protein
LATTSDRWDDVDVGLEVGLARELHSPRQQHFAESMLSHVSVEPDGELKRYSLMPVARCRRHEQFPVHELVPWGVFRSLVDESLDFLDRPAMLSEGGHGHKLLGAAGDGQANMPNRTTTMTPGDHHRIAHRNLAVLSSSASRA